MTVLTTQNIARKQVLTTGEVARVCHVAPRTVSKWVDTGKLRGYRIPGSRDRRVPRQQLLAFLRAHGMPTDGLDGALTRVLIVDRQATRDLADSLQATHRYEAHLAHNGFEAGVLAEQCRPHVVIVDADDMDEACAICRHIKARDELADAKVLAATAQGTIAAEAMIAKGFDGCVIKPYTLERLSQAVEQATNLIT